MTKEGHFPRNSIICHHLTSILIVSIRKVLIEKPHKQNDIFELGPSKTFHKSWGKNDDGLLSDGKKMMTNDRVSWKMASHSGFTFTHEFASPP